MPTGSVVKPLFLEAVDLGPQAREAFLLQLREKDTELHARVLQLLSAHERADDMAAEAVERGLPEDPALGLELPARLGNYELLEEVASGGAGIVYRARQLDLGRTVAIKLLRAGRLATEAEVRRFQIEAEAAARLDHESIVPVHEVGTHEGRHFICMKLVEGASLAECGERYRDPRAAAELVARVAHAVDHGHRHAVLHRDLKPSNVLIDADGKPYVADFGTAKLLDDRNENTLTGWIVGTPTYMAPEQARSTGEVTVATDVYALGCVLYELLVGRPPFVTEDLVELLGMIQAETPRRVRTERSDVPRDLETICHTCLAKEPARRYVSALALAKDLERWLGFEPIHARPASRLERFLLVWRRKPVVSTLVATVAALIVVLVAGSIVTGFQLRRGLRETHAAEDLAREQLRTAYVAEARALRGSGRVGQRVRGLELLRLAAEIRPGTDLVSEATASLALTDLVTLHEWPRPYSEDAGVRFDHDMERYTLSRMDGGIEVRRVDDGSLIRTLTGQEQPGWTPIFSRDGRYLSVTHHPPRGSRTEARFVVWDLQQDEIVFTHDEISRTRLSDFAPDRPVVLLATWEGRLFERDLTSGAERLLVQFPSHEAAGPVKYSPDGRHVAVLGANPGPVRIYGLGGELEQTLGEVDEWYYDLAWSPDGTRIATGSGEARVEVWAVESGALLRTCVGHTRDLVWVLFPRDDVIASYAWDNTTRLWDANTAAQLLVSEGFEVAAASDGRQLSLIRDGSLIVQELRHRDVLRTLQADSLFGARHMDLSPDGRFVATGGGDALEIWHLESEVRIDRLDRNVLAVRFLSDRGLLVGSENALELWEIEDGRLAGPPELLLTERCRGIDRDRDGDLVAALTGSELHLIQLLHPERGLRIPLPSGAAHLALDPDGAWVATGNFRGSGVHVWSTQDGTLAAHLQPSENFCAPSFSPDGRLLVLGLRTDYEVLRTGTWTREYGIRRTESGVPIAGPISPDGRLLAIPIDDWRIGLFDTETGSQLTVLQAPDVPMPCRVRFAPDGRSLLIGTSGGQILVWQLDRLRDELQALGLADDRTPSAWPLSEGAGRDAK